MERNEKPLSSGREPDEAAQANGSAPLRYTRHAAIEAVSRALCDTHIFDYNKEPVFGFFYDFEDHLWMYVLWAGGLLSWEPLSKDNLAYMLTQAKPGAALDWERESAWEKKSKAKQIK